MNNLFQNRAREHHSSLNNLAVKLQQAVHSKQVTDTTSCCIL